MTPSPRDDGAGAAEPRFLDLNLHCGAGRRNAWEDPSFAGSNRLPPHSRRVRSMMTPGGYTRCVCLDSGGGEGDGSNGDSNEVCGKDGIDSKGGWTFRLFPDPHSIPKSCVEAGGGPGDADGDPFREAVVPSCWTMTEATDPPRYTNVQMPFDVLYPHVPRGNPTGVYRLVFAPLGGG